MTFMLVSNDYFELVLTTAESQTQKEAIKELRLWAKQHNHTIARNAQDDEATAFIRSIELVS